jgi:ligand-binding sensor domain-containing protein/AraC-like DNA-binding protein
MNKRLVNPYGTAWQLTTAVLIFFLSLLRLPALDPDQAVERYLVDRWEISGGIPSNSIVSIAQTPDGYLWIATSRGLVRFDGIVFTAVDFAGDSSADPREKNIPQAMFTGRQGTLWIGSASGLTSYKHRSRRFETLSPAHGLTRDGIRRIMDDMHGNLWISFYTSYVNRLANGEFTAFNSSRGLMGKKINAIVEDRKGNLLFGTRENGVFVFQGETFAPYPIDGLENRQIITMYEDRRGNLWIGSNDGLFRVNEHGTAGYNTRHGLSNNFITCIREDRDRNLWVGTIKGLNRVKQISDRDIAVEHLFQGLTVTCLLEDRERSLWIGSNDSGARRLKDGKFTSYQLPKQYEDEILMSIFQDRRGDAWVGTLSGNLFHCRDHDFIEAVKIPAISGTGISSIIDDADGSLWLGTNGKGVFRWKGGTFTRWTVQQGLADNLVTSISRDSRGNLWLGTFDGVSVLNPDTGAIRSLKARDGLWGKRVHNVYEDSSHNTWIAADKGITVLKGGKPDKRHMEHYLQDVPVTCIYEERPASGEGTGVFWLATHGGGLKRLKQGKIVSFTTAHGMTTDFIYQFFQDPVGNFWLMSNSGILRVSKNELDRLAGGAVDYIDCTSFGISDGMKSLEFHNEYSRHSAMETGGEFRFITQKGITVVKPAEIRVNKSPPPVVIEALFFDEQPVPLGGDTAEYVCEGINDFRFHFTAPTFLAPGKIKFKYRLEGFDPGWVLLRPGQERIARFHGLRPGTYTFQVIAGNNEGVWNRAGDTLTFTLEPLFHQTILFKIVLIFLLALLAGVIFYIYKKWPIKKKEKYKGSHLNPEYAGECIKKLTYLMEIEAVYRDSEISLQSLAEKLSITPHLLSQVLNEKLNRNFSDFINYYRIEEARKILQTPAGEGRKVASVAFDVGFNTTVAFYNAFRKYTGMTPAQYKKKKKTDNRSQV